MASRKQEHIDHITERCLIAQKNFRFKERSERDWKYWCKRCRGVNRQFSAPSAWVFVLICVKKTISMKILVLRVINSSRQRNCFIRGYIHSLFVSKALTRSYLAAWVFTQTTRECNPVRGTFYDVNYIYSRRSSWYFHCSRTVRVWRTESRNRRNAWQTINILSRVVFSWVKFSLLFFALFTNISTLEYVTKVEIKQQTNYKGGEKRMCAFILSVRVGHCLGQLSTIFLKTKGSKMQIGYINDTYNYILYIKD